MWAPWRGAGNPGEGEEAATTSLIRIIQEIQGGEEMPPNVQVKPFFPKSNLYTTLNVRVPGRTVGSNSLPSGHTDLNRCHPSLKENFLHRIMVVEVFSTPFRPQMVQNEAPEYVERLPNVREASGVVREEARGVIFELRGSFAKERKRPGDLQIAMGFPCAPYALESVPRFLGHGTVEQIVLRGLLGTRAPNLAVGRDIHELQPKPHWEALVEGEPYEGAHFPWSGVVPDPGYGLLGGCVPQSETLDEG
jgi:hypothetical protein